MANEDLSLIITSRCNLSCCYCYQNAKTAQTAEWDLVQAGIGLVFRDGPSNVEMIFLGGEPLLEFDLLHRAVSYAETFDPCRKNLRFALSTNGTLISETAADYLDEHEFDVQLSFDGVQQAQGYRGSDTFEILDHVLDSLQSRHPRLFRTRLRVSLTVIPNTFSFLADSVKYLLEKDVREILISPCITPYPGWCTDRINELDKEFGRVAEISLDHLRHTGKLPVTLLRKASNEIPQKGPGLQACKALTGAALTMDVDGQLYACPLLVESYQRFPPGSLMEQVSALKLGNVRDPEVRKRRAALAESAGATNLLASLQSGRSSYGSCDECEYLGRCSVCPVSIWQASAAAGPYRIPDFICAFNKVTLKYRDRFPSLPEAYKRFFPGSGDSDVMKRLEEYLRVNRSP